MQDMNDGEEDKEMKSMCSLDGTVVIGLQLSYWLMLLRSVEHRNDKYHLSLSSQNNCRHTVHTYLPQLLRWAKSSNQLYQQLYSNTYTTHQNSDISLVPIQAHPSPYLDNHNIIIIRRRFLDINFWWFIMHIVLLCITNCSCS